MPSLLIVDDEPDILEATKMSFEFQGYEVFTAQTVAEALKSFEASQPQLLLVDYKLPHGETGLDFLKSVREKNPTVPAIMITGLTHQTENIEEECRKLKPCGFLQKPLKMEVVLQAAKDLLSPPH